MAPVSAQMTLAEIDRHCQPHALTVFGAFHPSGDDKVLRGVGTLVLIGPREPGFWGLFTRSPEYQDGHAHPLDRWSERLIGGMATELGATAFFPFGGPPFMPFIRWAHHTGRTHQSPVGLLVHDEAGLMVSYRGALGLTAVLDLPETPPSPCTTCATKPCLTACPVDAFANGFYDVPTCKADLKSPENDCMAMGCAVRRSCPVSQRYNRLPEQSAFHMEAFQ